MQMIDRIAEILKTEYSTRFDKIRKDMVVTSFYKYGPIRENYGSGRIDATATAENCIEAFKKDGNTEHLADAANYLMFQFMYPLPGQEYRPTDSGHSVKPVGTPINEER